MAKKKTTVDTLKELNDYKESLKGKSLDELKEIEQALIKEADEISTEIDNVTFDVPQENLETISTYITYFLNKRTIAWTSTLAEITLYEFWANHTEKTIPYALLDQTFRQLGEGQFTGYDEWKQIVEIDKYLEVLKKPYIEANSKIYELSARHSAVMDAMKLESPIQINS